MDEEGWDCSVEGCGKPAGPKNDSCRICKYFFCDEHHGGEDHHCSKASPDEIDIIWDAAEERQLKLNFDRMTALDLTEMADALRPGHHSVLHVPEDLSKTGSFAGTYHINFPLEFDDGVKWWARLRREGFALPRFGMGKSMLDSEVATHQILHAAGLKVPQAWHPVKSPEGDNFCFVEHVNGAPWHAEPTPTNSTDMIALRDFAKFHIQLSSLTFAAIGSPEGGQHNVIGSYRSMDYVHSAAPYFFGPYNSQGKLYVAYLNYHMEKLAKGWRPLNFVESYLGALEVRTLIENDQELSAEVESTYIKYGDTRNTDHIFVDESSHITGIIDWEFAVTTIKACAFAAPLAFIDFGSFWDGDNSLSPMEEALASIYDELGRKDLGDCVRHGKKYQRLEIHVGYLDSWKHLSALIEAMTGDKPKEQTQEEWKEAAMAKYACDNGLHRLLHGDK